MFDFRNVFSTVALIGLIILGSGNSAYPQTPSTLLYSRMNATQKRQFIETEIERLLSKYPPATGYEVDAAGIDKITAFVESYAKRRTVRKAKSVCTAGDSLTAVLKRGAIHVPAIIKSFERENAPADLGIYLAMSESEFCPCNQEPTGPLGMFQFTAPTGSNYGLDTVRGATPAKPDERCDVGKSARAAARYLNKLLKHDYEYNRVGIPLSVAAYNSGEGNLNRLLREAKEATKSPSVSFWTLTDFVVNKRDKWIEEKTKSSERSGEDGDDDAPYFPSSKQFLGENINYVPQFFAVAIIGENPKVFGINMTPLSKMK